MTRFQELRRAELVRVSNRLPAMLDRARRRWAKSSRPSIALREMRALERTLERYASKRD